MTGPREDPIARYEHTLIHEGSARLSSAAASKGSTTSLAISDIYGTERNRYASVGGWIISALDVRTGRLQWRTALHGRGHHKIEYTLEASLRQMRPRKLGGHDLSAGRLPAY